jgi:uncharacterized SAM-binding protein YcdF (DUF218 family)
MKYLLLVFIGLVVFIITAISIYLSPNELKACKAPTSIGACSRADAIVAVSGGDTGARASEAIKLYKQGWAPKLIFSGAAADVSGPSNARAMSRRAIEAGVPASAIIIEELSRTTAENALNTSRFIAEQNLNRIILVTSAYHQRRASLEFSSILGPSVTIVNHPVPTDKQWVGFWWWTTARGWWLAGGELIKIIAFYSAQGASSL